MRNTSSSFSGTIPLIFEGAPDGPFAGDVKHRGVRDCEHSTLCRAFGLDQTRFYFDLCSTMRGIGPNTRGAASLRQGQREVSGFVFMAGRDAPVAKLTVTREGKRFRDEDPTSVRDFQERSYT